MNPLASKVWHRLYPDRRPWQQLDPSTQAEWSRMVDVVAEVIADDILAQAEALETTETHTSHPCN
jgi:hypothetical protein